MNGSRIGVCCTGRLAVHSPMMKGSRSVLVAAMAALAGLAPRPRVLAAELLRFGPPSPTRCRVCESSSRLTGSLSVKIPAHAIVLDFGNGIFWRNSRLVVVDLDRAEAQTYRFEPKASRPTTLALLGTRALTQAVIRDLVRKTRLIWSPPLLRTPPMPIPDVFETVYVVDGPVMAQWMGGENDPGWYSALKNAIRAIEAG